MFQDHLERMLAGVAVHAKNESHPLQNCLVEISVRGVKTLREFPAFRLYDSRTLVEKINALDISDDEQQMIRRHLPYDEFAVTVHNVMTMFFWKGCVLPEDASYEKPAHGETLYSIAAIDHGDGSNDEYQFFGPVMMLDAGDQLDLYTPHPPGMDRERISELYEASEETMHKAVTLLNILSVCRNQVVSCKTPDKLKKKRAKQGKYPQYEYKVLTLDPVAIQQLPAEQRAQVTGRLSPRTHTRRGHVRRLPSGKVTWVRSSIINAPYYADGVIVKDYEIHNTE